MNSAALIAAAERLITLTGFRWMPGIRDIDGCRVLSVEEDGSVWVCGTHDGHIIDRVYGEEMSLPDLTDPATLGCIERMVQDAWNDPTMFAKSVPGGYMLAHVSGVCMLPTGLYFPMSCTKAECLVAALAAAPTGDNHE